MKTNILMVGAGGIGCELLKLFYTGKSNHNISIIDYDTVSITNLNRQFLFTDNDIDLYKAKITSDAYMHKTGIMPTFYINSVMNFDFHFFKKFDIVYNCLDNHEARAFVCKLCLYANVPVIDGGSSGFQGQSWSYTKDGDCYDCLKPVNNEYPVCSIRNRPTLYEHCVIWAKTVFFAELILHKKNHRNLKKFLKSQKLKSIYKTCLALLTRSNLYFDKEDALLMSLIHNVSVQRATSFNIPTKPLFETESIAGNIIPSICTTNSIIASLMYLMGHKKYNTKNYYLTRSHSLINPIFITKWNSSCETCSCRRYVLFHKNIVLRELIDLIKTVFNEEFIIYDSESLIYSVRYDKFMDEVVDLIRNDVLVVKGENEQINLLVCDGSENRIEVV